MSGSLPAMLSVTPLLTAVVRPIWIICFSSCAPLLSFAACPGGTEMKVPSARTTANTVTCVSGFTNRCASIFHSFSFEGALTAYHAMGEEGGKLYHRFWVYFVPGGTNLLPAR